MRFGCLATLGLLHACGYDWTVIPDDAPGPISKGSFVCGPVRCMVDEFCIEVTDKLIAADYRCVPFTCSERDCSCKDVAAKCPGSCEAVKGGGTLARCSVQ